MNILTTCIRSLISVLVTLTLSTLLINAQAADRALLDVLLENGVIDHKQYEQLLQKSSIQYQDLLAKDEVTNKQVGDHIDLKIEQAMAKKIEDEVPVKINRGKKGFRFETRDGNWQTNLQWRAQFRYTDPSAGDPRQLSKFNDEDQSILEARRLRMKIGGHGYQPWLKYYFEVDLQPSRDVDDDSSKASARVIDYRLDVDKWDWGGFREG